MEIQEQATLQGRHDTDADRTTARAVGALFLAGMVAGIGGNGIIESVVGAPDHLATVSANGRLLAIGALLMMLAAVWDAAHGILMFPILRRHGERIAFGYLGYRLVDAVFIGLWILFLLFQIPLGREYLNAGVADMAALRALSTVSLQASQYAYQIAMLFVGLAGLLLCSVFFRARLVPRSLAVWGLAGYAIHLGGAALELLGFDLWLIPVIPGGLWELFIRVWLIAKGFSAPSVPAERATSPTTPGRTAPTAGSATA